MNLKTSTNPTNWLTEIPSAIALLDVDLKLTDASQSWFKKFNFLGKEEEIKGKSIFDLFPRFNEDWKVKLEYVLDGLANIQIMDKIQKKDGNTQKHLWNLNPWKDGYGKQIGIILNTQDIGENHHLKLELQRTKSNLYQNGKMAKIGSWEYSIEENTVVLLQNIREILGTSSDTFDTMEDMVVFYKEGKSRDTIKTALEMAIRGGKPWEENVQINTVQNKTLLVNSIGRPKFKNGSCSRIIGTIQAIPQNKTEDTVSNWDYKEFFKLSPVAMVVSDYTSGKFLIINDALSKLIGKTEEQVLNKSYRNFLDLKALSQKNPISQLSKTGEYGPIEINYIKGKNKNMSLKIKGKLIENPSGKKVILSTVTDITEYREKQLVLEEIIGETKNEIKKLVNFAHMASHNLKGQASNFSLLLQFLKTETKEEERNSILSMLFQATDSLTDTIKGLREIVTIRQNINLRKRSLVLNDYVFKAEQGLSGLIKQEHAKIVNEAPDDLKVRALPVYLESILSNILSNAIKFKKDDKKPVVIVKAQVQKYYTVVSIEDNGIGIDMELHQEKLFGIYETFQRNGDARGMGLYLVKYQMELMKGRIECESVPNEGTVFRLFFSNR